MPDAADPAPPADSSPSSSEVSAPESIVRSFVAAIEAKDLDAALALLADDVEYDNVPMSKVHGATAVRDGLAPFVERFDEVAWPISVLIASGTADAGQVFTERVDRFRSGDRWMELPVAGLFTIADSRIALWRDYFDLATFTRQMAALG